MVVSDQKHIDKKELKCGIVMPISLHSDYPPEHWKDVLNILIEAIGQTSSFKPNIVSDDEAIGLIHERIVTNLYSNEMVVCDVSSKNPNVMFELGLRLAFDKPVIIIKDEKTSYSFDTGVIEHLSYPSSLRFSNIVLFKTELSKKIEATYKKAVESPNFSPFLKSFGKTIVPAKIKGEEVSETTFLIDLVTGLKDDINRIRFELRGGGGIRLDNKIYTDKERPTFSDRLRELYLEALKDRKAVTYEEFLDYVWKSFTGSPNINIPKAEIEALIYRFWRSLGTDRPGTAVKAP